MGAMATRRAEEEQRICLHGLVAATETMALSLTSLTDWLLAMNEQERGRLLAKQGEMRKAGMSVTRICRQMIADSVQRERALRPRPRGKSPAAGGKQPGQLALSE